MKPESLAVDYVPLHEAVLCADCEYISASLNGACPVCGSHSLLSLSRILGGNIGDDRVSLLELPEPIRPTPRRPRKKLAA